VSRLKDGFAAGDGGTRSSTNARYHHGDLHRALVDAAMTILHETQRWDFSLREVARRAGVSHNAPYGHFADKQALLAAVGIAGYAMLRDRMLAVSADAADAAGALDAIGQVYIAFGLRNPGLYRLMFGQELQADGVLRSDVREAANAARSVLQDVVMRGADDGSFAVDAADPTAIMVAVLSCWSVVHGFTLLAIDGLSRTEDAPDNERLAALVADRFRRGLIPR
jgi:AcrR family transcriptional regulator